MIRGCGACKKLLDYSACALWLVAMLLSGEL